MNLHIKTGLGIKNYVLDPNSNVEYEIFLTDFSWQIWAKNTKLNFSSESVKTKEHIESNSCEKYYFLINVFYKINFWPILKKLLQKNRFSSFSTFSNFCPIVKTEKICQSSGIVFISSLLIKQQRNDVSVGLGCSGNSTNFSLFVFAPRSRSPVYGTRTLKWLLGFPFIYYGLVWQFW